MARAGQTDSIRSALPSRFPQELGSKFTRGCGKGLRLEDDRETRTRVPLHFAAAGN